MDSIKLKGGGEKVGHQTRQVTFMSALVIPLIALLDRKWPVSLLSFPRLKCLSGLDGNSKCLSKMLKQRVELATLTLEYPEHSDVVQF